MRALQQNLLVPFHYPVHFTEDLFHPENPLLASVAAGEGNGGRGKVLCVVDRGVCRKTPGLLKRMDAYCRKRAGLSLARAPLVVPGGEAVKNSYQYVHLVQEAIHQGGLCRQSYVLAVGGGAVLDMAGYAAASAHRGVRLIRVPTTVLSQDDSGMGVKNGINAFGKKNFLGAFAPPFAVLNDWTFLRTLSDRDWRSGIAEAVKVALIKDAEFFEFLEQHAAALAARDMGRMRPLIHRCAELHLQHIQNGGDPFECGSSRPLDFGHWAAHKLEQLSGFRLRHGEAVAMGMALDATYANLLGLLPGPAWRRVLDLLLTLGFAVYAPEMDGPLSRENPDSLLHGLDEFREHLGGPLTIMLLEGIGRGVEVHEIDDGLMAASLRILASSAKSARRCAV
jgi:3-dehydroquinate synthase